ncbi:MAG: cyclopropane-fatty-acyl-phospholipid synthase family protein [Chitinophagales bacterium]|nr:cyclopropane-fatty-acyl-phospholipid synthase family protein [Chitinophagales bacterium]
MTKISDFVKVRKESLSSRYLKQKVSAGHFIEDYMSGHIDLIADFKDLMRHKDEVWEYDFTADHWKFFFTRFIPEVAIHSKEQDERIVRTHYDNKNDLFNWFLGPRMVYTTGFYKHGQENLEEAQDNKMDLIAQKLQFKAGETMLDIGCGWGTFVMHAAKYYGMDATGITIAQAGADWGNNQIRENGVEHLARIQRMDYREIPHKLYDKITCLEMAEHVGIKNFKKFMAQIYGMLKDDGMFYLQIAALRERATPLWGPNQEDIVWGLFMNRYIFSGADASMPVNWDLKRIESVGFEVHSVENVGIHYSRTIDHWYQNWMRNQEKVLEKYGEYTFRMYQIFLGWSVEIARQGSSSAYQIVCHKNLNNYNRERFVNAVQFGELNQFKQSKVTAPAFSEAMQEA